jgi:phosphoribosylformimino-5-aminoimidazole carboxamide ribotide isomerase
VPLAGTMRIIPVLDLQNGVVVRGIAGQRQEYRPIVSQLTASCQPAEVARAFRDHFGLTELYLADLDAIASGVPAPPLYADIRSLGISLWVDAGVRDPAQAVTLAAAGVESIIIGLETIHGPNELRQICSRLRSESIVFSLDLKNGLPLGHTSNWDRPDADSIARQAIALGVRRLLVLDLARVGVGTGTGTEEICARLAADYPEVEIASGGGVSGIADLERLRRCGVRAVLVASALHDGRLQRADLTGFLTSLP